MRKRLELRHEHSCLNKADNDEMIFVLIGRDVAAPATIRFWVEERVRLGKNKLSDDQIKEALGIAQVMEMENG